MRTHSGPFAAPCQPCPHCGQDLICQACLGRAHFGRHHSCCFCHRCSDTGLERFHTCCLVTDRLTAPVSLGQLAALLSRPSAAGHQRTVSVYSLTSLCDPTTGVSALPRFADRYLPPGRAFEEQAFELMNPYDPWRPTFVVCQLVAAVLRQCCRSWTASRSTATLITSSNGNVDIRLATSSLRADIHWLEIDRLFVGEYVL